MTVYHFQFIAEDLHGDPMQNAVGSYYSASDAAFATPLLVTLQDGTSTTTPAANRKGLVTFSVDTDLPRGYWKSGDQTQQVSAWEAADDAAAAALASQTAAEAAQAAAEAAAGNATAPTETVVQQVVDSEFADPSSDPRTTVDDLYAGRVSRAKHAPALGAYFPEAEGAVGDGLADDTTAWNNAILTAASGSGRATVYGRKGASYKITAPINAQTGANIDGQGATLTYTGTADRPLTLTSTLGVKVSNLTLDVGAKASGSAVFASSCDQSEFHHVKITSTATGCAGFRLFSCTNSIIDRCPVQGTGNAYNITGASSGCKITNSIATGTPAGVLINPSGSSGPSDIDVAGVIVKDFPSGVVLSYPIRSAGTSTARNTRIRFIGCTVIGPNLAFNANGTADQINMVYTDGGTVEGCHSLYGGDMGFSFSNCNYLTIVGNLSMFNDTAGINPAATNNHVTVTGNTCLNNGQNRTSSHSSTDPLAGVLVGASNTITVTGNTLADDQATHTQQWAIATPSTSAAPTGLVIAGNTDSGNVLGRFRNGNSAVVRDLDGAAATAYGKRAAYASVVASATVTTGATANTWTAFPTSGAGAAPTITLPNDGGIYRIDMHGTDATASPAALMSLGLSGDGGSTWIKQSTNNQTTTSGYDRVHMSAGNVTGSGQTITVWAMTSVANCTATLVASGSSPLELWATRIA